MRMISALFGFFAVALGAFGAHKLHDVLVANQREATWQTAAHYHLIHAVVLLVIAVSLPSRRLAFGLFVAGITVFSGTLYVLSLTNILWLGRITPLGGACLLAGWLVLAFQKPRAGEE